MDALEYANLVTSCQGEDEKRLPIHCGPAKADWPGKEALEKGLMVSPLDKDCEAAFRFTVAGEIRPVPNQKLTTAANETIKHLRLDVKKLEASRRSAIEGILEGIESYDTEEIQQQIKYFSKKDEDGRFQPFCSAVTYTLKLYVSITEQMEK